MFNFILVSQPLLFLYHIGGCSFTSCTSVDRKLDLQGFVLLYLNTWGTLENPGCKMIWGKSKFFSPSLPKILGLVKMSLRWRRLCRWVGQHAYGKQVSPNSDWLKPPPPPPPITVLPRRSPEAICPWSTA